MRLRFALLLALGGCAHLREKPAQETPGARLFLRDPNGDGRKQWYLQVAGPEFKDAEPDLIFDEEKPGMAPPAGPVTLTRRVFTPGEPPPGHYLSYNMLVLTDDPPAGRGVIYLFVKQLSEAHPLLWWGLESEPGFDDASPADNWAKLQALFKKP